MLCMYSICLIRREGSMSAADEDDDDDEDDDNFI